MAQAPYPHLTVPPVNNLASKAKASAKDLHCASSLLASIASQQQGMVSMLLDAVHHLAAALLQTYVEEGITVHTVPLWLIQALKNSITNSTYATACTLDMLEFIRGEMHQRVQYGFIILLPAADLVRTLRDKLKLSRIAMVPQAHHQQGFIINLLENLVGIRLVLTNTTNRKFTSELKQFGKYSPCIV